MNAKERILALFDDDKSQNLDRVPTHVQYIDPPFISKYQDYFEGKYNSDIFNQYFGAPYSLGFDSVFAPFPSSIDFKSFKISTQHGNEVRIGLDGQSISRKTAYYEGGYVDSLEILKKMRNNLNIVDKIKEIQRILKNYENMESYIYPMVMTNGIFDRVWQAMGMTRFSKHFKNKSKLYKELIQFYAKITEIEVKELIKAADKKKRIITILDDVAFKGRAMISPKRWETDFLPYYKKINNIISKANMIPLIHTDGDPTELIPFFQKAGFRGLQGWEGGADPFLINKKFPGFVVVGFGDVSHILPHGTKSQIKTHVQELMNALKENKHFIIGPSTIIYEKIPLENVKTFMEAIKEYGRYS